MRNSGKGLRYGISCLQHQSLSNLVLFHRLSRRTILMICRRISAAAELLPSVRSSRNFSHEAYCIGSSQFKLHDDPLMKSMIRDLNGLQRSMPRRDFSPKQDVARANSVISHLCEEGKIRKARELFEEMRERDVITWTALISGCMKCGMVKEARELFERDDAERNGVTWTAMISGLMKTRRVAEAEKLFDEMPEKNVVAWNTMVEGYVRSGNIDQALVLFERMRERNIVSWNTMITGLVSCGRIEDAKGIFDRMPVTLRNVISWNILITGLARSGRIDEASLLFDRMPERSVASWNTMISGFMLNGEVETAERLFEEMPSKNVVSWTAVISGYARNGRSEEALRTFYAMNRSRRRVRPNEVTFASVLGACGDSGCLVQGMQVHQVLSKTIHQESEFVISSLINMYSKCGELAMARKVFDHCLGRSRDLVCWNSMISAYAHHGNGRGAVSLFEEMQRRGLNPDDVTYIGLLSACSHAGLVNEGVSFFEMLLKDKSVKVREEHYSCIIDLYSRAGRLEEAFELIKTKLPSEASINSWCTLLSGCKIHGNDDVGKMAAEKLLDVERGNAGTYALVCSLYSVCGGKTEAETVKVRMKEEGMKKQPGCSWIEVGNKFHVFVVADRFHQDYEEMQFLIFDLHEKMKNNGVVDVL